MRVLLRRLAVVLHRVSAVGAAGGGGAVGCAAVDLGLDVGTVLNVLVEVANVAADLVPRLQREGNDWYEAKGEPLPALEYMAAEVAAVLALASDLLVALEARGEGVLSASKEEEHGRITSGWVMRQWRGDGREVTATG